MSVIGIDLSTIIPLSYQITAQCVGITTVDIEIDGGTPVQFIPNGELGDCRTYYYATGFMPGTPPVS